jgi:hypothetical protein
MFFKPLAISLLLLASIDQHAHSPYGTGVGSQVSQRQKEQLLRAPRHSLTACIARAVRTDPRYIEASGKHLFNELITTAAGSCVREANQLIDIHDELFGTGSGLDYFLGAYLDDLPFEVHRLLTISAGS